MLSATLRLLSLCPPESRFAVTLTRMQAWPSPPIRSLPGHGKPLRIFDTATSSVRELAPAVTARLYVCGITPYDATHLGHAFTYLTYDLAQRVLRDAGHHVHYVQNVTDVDDPLLERATRDGLDWRALADREIDLFREDMTALRMLAPDAYVGVVEAIPMIVDMVVELVDRGAAYQVDDDLYFSIATAPAFGEISHLSRAEMLAICAERGGDPRRTGKKDPLDPLLWRAHRPGEPSWPSPFGPGRPGWHIECSAIARHYLGGVIDIQGGGTDLSFPHHECSAAHAEVAAGIRPFARSYVHTAMVSLDGHKMSKSRGNLEFVSRLRRAGVDPAALRLALLDHRHTEDWEWTPGLLDDAVDRMNRWRAAVALPTGPDAMGLLAAVRERLADDLDAPGAVAAVDAWVGAALADAGGSAGAGPDPTHQGGPVRGSGGDVPAWGEAPALVRRLVDTLLGVDLEPVRPRGS
ncbi:cysteinyl-tRNA synthetase [Frankia casuarinae]|uniref:L-cysteine:1D-myo-inositol 2-amino-2-deoxy-alpha-D-glucopyranoside ligase n=3 Tax=Frankiaceae TaxID=74712 RepID=MSHC_FRACC|nr:MULTISPECIES: cysteine--1-D-myo-inosityl 2-amino-2-deoxy-alpha-D-glucopyranoside ligase [Frankia]Q2J9N8.1 RecName: Full=L-cysteine:1D-myo-inositol 2-amino-2-deoxy-alpha-D-glucopyranoside ligase; Short=L-Cys:GlcN-Ins ligase; AltName: Full=Mycothiol ligase; Short=MSH ligase [Frankia casuarinae]ABD12004.1 cysteinyl-tRNA synthetase [Frankia casuarinae]ETA01853.1 cysteinyl-tRNA synthetase [Frankia sp. CcI6]EYT92536.1 cysteinyl-tRNA synthetase [Frankia casuarinae]KDA43055.1 cysteinyl-tRNA synthet